MSIIGPNLEHNGLNDQKFIKCNIWNWLNLDLGIETCFLDGMDEYVKRWLQLISLVCMEFVGLIIVSREYSPRIAKLFGSNPVAVPATLSFLSPNSFVLLLLHFPSPSWTILMKCRLLCGCMATSCIFLIACFIDTSDLLSPLHFHPHYGTVVSSEVQLKALLLDQQTQSKTIP